ncbi:MAG: hypothetical protein LIQ31_04735, partial [Planctomycetes bacterium]|nr:hypothetical protein [Planctomycetota bacterium]
GFFGKGFLENHLPRRGCRKWTEISLACAARAFADYLFGSCPGKKNATPAHHFRQSPDPVGEWPNRPEW